MELKEAEKIRYIAMALYRWDRCKLDGLPPYTFGGMSNGSIGFMAVFDDMETLNKAFPDGVSIIKVYPEDSFQPPSGSGVR